MSNYKLYSASLLSGILLILIFPGFNFEIFAWISLVPLFIATRKTSPLASLKLGFIAGFVFYIGVIYWVVIAMTKYGGIPMAIGIAVLILLSGYLAIYISLWTFLISVVSRQLSGIGYVLAPFLWVTLELIRAHFLTGFPWGSLGYSQFKTLPVIQIADVTGVYGVSFIIVMVNAAIALFIESITPLHPPLNKGGSGGVRQFATRYMLATAILLISFLIYGFWRMNIFENPPISPFKGGLRGIKVALIQGNIEQDMKWDEKYQNEVFDAHVNLTMQASLDKPDLIVWPESATPFYFQTDRNFRSKMIELAQKEGSFILFGTPGYEITDGKNVPYNRAYLLSPHGDVAGKYDKIHLVPFGEYVPLRKILFFIDKMVVGIGDFQSGEEYTIFKVQSSKFKAQSSFGTLICFEVIFPDLVRRFVKNGAEFLVNITNDGWYGKTAASSQHIAMVVFRAVENRVPVVRAANTGISGIIEPTGNIKKETDIFVRTHISGEINIATPLHPPLTKGGYWGGKTFYTQYGDVFAYLCVAVTLLLFFLSKELMMKYKFI
jgi:apolipoprotein N-acyltransferase